MSFFALSSLINGLTATIFGSVVYFKNRKNLTNKLFGLMSFAVALWSYAYFVWQMSDKYQTALLFTKILSIGSIFIPIFYLHWVLNILNNDEKNKRIIKISYFLGVLFLALSFSNKFIIDVQPILDFKFWPKAGFLYSIYIFLYIFFVGFGIKKLLQEISVSFGQRRAQLLYILWGSIIGFGGGATNFFLWYGVPIRPYGNILVSLYTIILAYATVKHRLMDIKLVMRKWSVDLLTLFSIIIPALIIKLAINIFITTGIWIDFIILVVSVLLFPSFKNYFFRLANKYFFSSLYDTKDVIEDISDKLSSTLSVKDIYHFVSGSLLNVFHAKTLGVLTFDEKKMEYVLQHNVGLDVGKKRRFDADKGLQEKFFNQSAPIFVEELKSLYYKDHKETIDLLTGLGIEILVPLDVKNKAIGLLVIGGKESGDMYNEDDMSVLKIIGAQMAIALENALLYEQTKGFNIKLKKEIEIATSDLRVANEKLKQLDAAKSEFISIASHQLRTPLTAIKGYISMIMEGDFGKVTEKIVDPLHKVFDSNERLIKLMENLLNISRIESGRLQFNYEEVQMEEMVDSIIFELSPAAKKKNLELIYIKPEQLTPKVNIDAEKIRQVVMNLTDNAVKYTPEGIVKVELSYTPPQTPSPRPSPRTGEGDLGSKYFVDAINAGTPGNYDNGYIEYSVTDSGIGINPSDLPNLFQKFFRGTGTSLIHTEGTGLGLYVARQMIETHNGQIWAESMGEGKGSKFVLRLPIR